MAYRRFGLGGQIIPFWKRQIEPLPKWQEGDPQIRVFLPTFWMKMIHPPQNAPKNQVYFITHPQMTKFDIKNYLEKIYQVPVAQVRTQVKLTSNEPPGQLVASAILMQGKRSVDPVRDKRRQVKRYAEEYKEAIVVLGKGETFEFPDIESKITNLEENEEFQEVLEKTKEEKKIQKLAGGVPGWFR